jgi:hypothetical protein
MIHDSGSVIKSSRITISQSFSLIEFRHHKSISYRLLTMMKCTTLYLWMLLLMLCVPSLAGEACLRKKEKKPKKPPVCPTEDVALDPSTTCKVQGQLCNYNEYCYQILDPDTLECGPEQTFFITFCTCDDDGSGNLRFFCASASLAPDMVPCGAPECQP